MVSSVAFRLRLCAVAIATAVAVVISAPAAFADTAPPDPALPKTVAADTLPTVQVNGVVWAQLIVGNTVYVGGEFTRARPAGSAPGVNEVVRKNMLAYNLTTGVLTGFNPNMNAAVRALVVSADAKRVFVGGNFTSVGGTARSRLAAFDTANGVLVSAFAPAVNSSVKALALAGSTLYAGGAFSVANNQTRSRIAAFATVNGALRAWKGNPVGGGVNSLAVSPDGTKVVIGGSFTAYNGGSNPGYGMAATNATTGASLPWKINALIRNGGIHSAILSLTSSTKGVFGTGYDFGIGGNFEGTFRANWADGSVIWLEDCHGDTYSAAPLGDVVYTTGHVHFCGNIGGFGQTTPSTHRRALAFTMKSTGVVATNTLKRYFNYAGNPRPSLLSWYPDINSGTYTGQGQGPWNVAANAQYVLYGGEFTIVNNKKQQGLVRFAVSAIAPDREGPRVSNVAFLPTAFVPTLSIPRAGTVRVKWTSAYDRDNEQLTYEVLRDQGTATTIVARSVDWKRPVITWTDYGRVQGRTYSYRIRVTDPFGNSRTGEPVSITVPAEANREIAPPTPPIDVTPAPASPQPPLPSSAPTPVPTPAHTDGPAAAEPSSDAPSIDAPSTDAPSTR